MAQSGRSRESSALCVHILPGERREYASSAQAFTGLYCEPPKPLPWPKFLAMSMATIGDMPLK
jgi:hypothetical protein